MATTAQRLTALEATAANHESRLDALEGTPTPPAGQSVTFAPGVTGPQIVNAVADDSLDLILLQSGTYTLPVMSLVANRTKVVTLRPVQPGTVTFKPAAGADIAFYLGTAGMLKKVTVEGIAFDGYVVGQRGVLTWGSSEDVGARLCSFRNITGQGAYSWCAYASSSNGAGATRGFFDDNDLYSATRQVGAIQLGHDPNARGFSIRRNKIAGFLFALHAGLVDATGLAFEANTLTNCGAMHDGGIRSVVIVGVEGFYKDNKATNCGGPYIYPANGRTMVDGGGNVWA